MPMTQDAWGHDEAEEDAEEEAEAGPEGDIDSEGISELQVSSGRLGQHAIQYPQGNSIVVQSPGSAPLETQMPGTLQQAVIQSISSGPATPKAPVTGLVSTSSSAETENTSRAAFSQLSALEAEFKELREDDSSHVKQLMYTVNLREHLRDQLREAQEQLEKDNQHLAERTVEVIGTANQGIVAAATAAAGSQAADPEDQLEEAPNSTTAAMLLQAAISSRQHREINGQQIAAEALGRVQSLMKDIAALRKRDEEEMQILRKNAESREALRVKIDSRRDQLQTDAGALLQDLSKIRGLVQDHEHEMQGEQVAQPVSDNQEGPQVASERIASDIPQQPLAALQERVHTLQHQRLR